jgi:hypothetical protein
MRALPTAALASILAALVVSGCNDRQADAPPAPLPAPVSGAADVPTPVVTPVPAPATVPSVAPAATAREVAAASGQAGTVTCDLLVRAKPPDGNALLFQLSLWCTADGRIRLRASKLDFDFIEALVAPDGAFVVELVRSHEIVRGNLRDISVLNAQGRPSGPPFLAYLSLLVTEAKQGAVPPHGPYRSAPPAPGSPTGSRAIAAKDPVSGLDAELTIGPDGHPLSKRLFDAPGVEALRLDYARFEHFHDLERATKLHLTVPGDASDYTVRMRTLDAVPAISEERMHFTPSPGGHEISLDEFLKRLNE